MPIAGAGNAATGDAGYKLHMQTVAAFNPGASKPAPARREAGGERGFVLFLCGVMAVVMIGCLGIAVDMGRLFIAKNEGQTYVDAAALAAALALDGTSNGVTNAQTAATGVGNKWNFMTNSFSGTTVEVATSLGGPWTAASSPPSPATGYTHARVTATVSVPLYFAPVITAFAGSAITSTTVKAQAVAAQVPQTTFNQGLFPFAPIGFDGLGGNTTAPWGFVVGQQYTMRYESSGKFECPGDDADPNHIKIGSTRGFWGSSSSSSTATAEIVGLSQEVSLTVGQVLPGVGGAKTSVADAIVYRINQDGDTTSNTYSEYLANPAHNGQRVVIMPIQSEVNDTVLGFGAFLLLDNKSYKHTGNENWCAVFIGPGVVDSPNGAAGPTAGAYQVKLVQ
jgi:Flp pilus assembly protein TadG